MSGADPTGREADGSSRVRLTRQTAFTSPDTHPLALDRLLGMKYGVRWLTWEPETLWQTITKDFSLKTEISKHARAGIQAVKTLHANDSFFLDWQVTSWVCVALDGVLPDFEVLQEVDPGQIMHAVTCAKRIRGQMEYDEEVQRWMAACFLMHGMLYAPPPVEFIQDEVAMTEATCTECGNVEWAQGLTECPACGAEQKKLRITQRNEWRDVKERWDMVKNLRPESLVLREDRIGVQIARLIVYTGHVKDQMDLLDRQLKELDLVPA